MARTASSRIQPEKITHPLQLMAAWFVMIVSLVSVLLTAAVKIEKPAWAPGFLVISAICLALIVIGAVFIMLTTFRPHLQGPKEYAEWLKDERRFRGQRTVDINRAELKELAVPRALEMEPSGPKVESLPPRPQDLQRYPVELSRLAKVDDVLVKLRRLGFQAEIYGSTDEDEYQDEQAHAAIWVGSRVPAEFAILAIKTVTETWQHLKYLHLSGDGDDDAPDYIHDQLYFGGATSTARLYKLQTWTLSEIRQIRDNSTDDEFHNLIRQKYR